ncbi:hypothetical protein LJK88_17100 [Paenibacillus sp. P26]|nr:hypothetical protein LJK88_17100 [Paenibacillus sp. P26]
MLEGAGHWETVSVPDFRGPTGEAGRWTGFYRSEFEYKDAAEGKRVYLVFKGVDYKATVYLNRKCLGDHEGFFAPFEFDVTDVLQEHNTLVVEVSNDYPMMGVGEPGLTAIKCTGRPARAGTIRTAGGTTARRARGFTTRSISAAGAAFYPGRLRPAEHR